MPDATTNPVLVETKKTGRYHELGFGGEGENRAFPRTRSVPSPGGEGQGEGVYVRQGGQTLPLSPPSPSGRGRKQVPDVTTNPVLVETKKTGRYHELGLFPLLGERVRERAFT